MIITIFFNSFDTKINTVSGIFNPFFFHSPNRMHKEDLLEMSAEIDCHLRLLLLCSVRCSCSLFEVFRITFPLWHFIAIFHDNIHGSRREYLEELCARRTNRISSININGHTQNMPQKVNCFTSSDYTKECTYVPASQLTLVCIVVTSSLAIDFIADLYLVNHWE